MQGQTNGFTGKNAETRGRPPLTFHLKTQKWFKNKDMGTPNRRTPG